MSDKSTKAQKHKSTLCFRVFCVFVFSVFSVLPVNAVGSNCCVKDQDFTICRVETTSQPCRVRPADYTAQYLDRVFLPCPASYSYSLADCYRYRQEGGHSESMYKADVEEEVDCSSNTHCAVEQSKVNDCKDFTLSDCAGSQARNCFVYQEKCLFRQDPGICNQLSKEFCGTPTGSSVCIWNPNLGSAGTCQSSLDASISRQNPVPTGYLSKILPPCAFAGQCTEVNDLLSVGINAARYLFGFIGSVALVMFVYGGFMIVLSGGSPERVQKGKDILVAAVIGIVISFSAYLIVNFLLTALGVGATFRAI